MTIEELFGTLQQSITKQWRDHLKTNKYSKHMALDEFYKEMPEKVDALIEAWQADNDPVEDYKNVLDEGMDALEYLKELKKMCKEGRKELLAGESELESLMDDILSLIDSTIYKVEKLHEDKRMTLKDFLNESLNEGRTCPDCINDVYAALKDEGIEDVTIEVGKRKNEYFLASSDPAMAKLLAKSKFNNFIADDTASVEDWVYNVKNVLATLN